MQRLLLLAVALTIVFTLGPLFLAAVITVDLSGGADFTEIQPAIDVAAANTNGDAVVNLSDAIQILSFLFESGPAPAEPFPDCGLGTLEVDNKLGCQMLPARCQ